MNGYLVEYKMFWGNKLIKHDVDTVYAYSTFEARKKVKDALLRLNRKARI